jgi:hypothetical protein
MAPRMSLHGSRVSLHVSRMSLYGSSVTFHVFKMRLNVSRASTRKITLHGKAP